MKKLVLISLLYTGTIIGQMMPGDMAFIAFNADGNDNFSMVTFKDIAPNTIIYFTDSEWNGSAFGTDEADFYWNSGTMNINAGTVITFNDLKETPITSYGTIVGDPGDLSGSEEALFAFEGFEARVPTNFIAAIANKTTAYGTLSNTGLTEGSTAITLPSGTDIAVYKGLRTGLTIAEYLVELNNLENYDIQDGTGDQSNDLTVPDVPFTAESFILPVDNTVLFINETELETIFTMYPNPVKRNAIVYFNQSIDIKLYDTFGKLILEKKSTKKLNVSNINSGTYYVQVNLGEVHILIVE